MFLCLSLYNSYQITQKSAPAVFPLLSEEKSYQILSQSKRILRAVSNAFHTENALCSVFALSGIIRHVNIHRAYAFAFAAGNTFFLIAFNTDQGKIAHRL